MQHFPFSSDWRMWISASYFSNLTIFFMCGVLWQSDSRISTKLRKVQIAWRGLIYRDTFRDRFRNRRTLACHLYDSTPTFDYSTLRAWAGDARRLFSRSLPSAFCLFNLFFLSREYHAAFSLFLVSMVWSCLPVIISRKTHVECNVDKFLS